MNVYLMCLCIRGVISAADMNIVIDCSLHFQHQIMTKKRKMMMKIVLLFELEFDIFMKI